MKKYEKPMVELTKFNAEDIIATSGDKRVEAIVNGGATYAPSDDATKHLTLLRYSTGKKHFT